ncbi:hypothetical protein VNI00_010876 [Paramarasmius palmivorus]|uniref:Uncharacterized protein n=1 Tax=Paramarasmius palmivorus TaxID=297713 RepID=A0AAW0CES3_9AGAR
MKETASIVHLLILFSHNIEHPKLLSHDLDTVTGVLEAASIYGNRPAVQACKSAISEIGKRSPEDALRVLRYKGTHSDFEDIDDMARRTMKLILEKPANSLHDMGMYLPHYNCIQFVTDNGQSRYKDKWERSMSKFRQVLDRGNVSRDYTNFGYLGDSWTVFSSEVEAQEVPTSAGVKEIACLINGLDVKEYKGLDPWLVWELESVIKGFPKWCDMIVM